MGMPHWSGKYPYCYWSIQVACWFHRWIVAKQLDTLVYIHTTQCNKNSKFVISEETSINFRWLTDWRVFFLFLPSCLLVVTASIRVFMLPSCAVFSAFSFSRLSFCNRWDFCRRFFSRRSRSLSEVVRSVLPTNSRFCFDFNHKHHSSMSHQHIQNKQDFSCRKSLWHN